jgi:tetratricopeptide (TPR) repeat protein
MEVYIYMDIKPPISQGPIVQPDQTPIDAAHDKRSGEQTAKSTAENVQTSANTVQAMKQAGVERKGSMKTGELFLKQALAGQLENKVRQNNEHSAELLAWPKSQGQSSNATPLLGSPLMSAQTPSAPVAATKTAGDPTAAARKEAQVFMDHGNKMLKEGRYSEAIEAYEEGFRTYPSPAFILNKASALLDSGRYSEAVLAYERYLSDPNAPRADEARAAMEKAKAAMGGHEPTITGVVESRKEFEKGQAAFKEGRYQEALEAFDKAYELNPIADFKYNPAAALEKLGRPYAAADRYQAYLDAKPDAKDKAAVNEKLNNLRAAADKAPITATGQGGGQEWMTRGNRLLAAGRYNEAVEAFNEGFRTYPDSKFILNKAAALLDGGRYAEADLAYQTYLSDPNAPRADEARAAQARARSHLQGGKEATATGVAESQKLFEQGTNLYMAGKYHEAFAAFERAYALNPLPDLRYNQAACLDRLGKRELAAQRYEAYLAEKPNASDAVWVRNRITTLHADALKAAQAASERGNAAYAAGKFKEAAAAYAEAYEQKPLPEFLYNMGAAYQRAGDTKQAVKNYQLYLSMHPDAKDAYQVRNMMNKLQKATGDELMEPDPLKASQAAFDRGQAAYAAGNFREAAAAFTAAYELNPIPEFLYNIGAAYHRAGDTKRAVQNYQLYLSKRPDAKDADQVRNMIHKLLEKTGDGLMQP